MDRKKALSIARDLAALVSGIDTPEPWPVDTEASNNAGYNIYRDPDHFYNYICDLGNCIELNMTENHYTRRIPYGPEPVEPETLATTDIMGGTITIYEYNVPGALGTVYKVESSIPGSELASVTESKTTATALFEGAITKAIDNL